MEDVIRIPMHGKHGIGKFLVFDRKFEPNLKGINWTVDGYIGKNHSVFYAYFRRKIDAVQRKIYAHRLIMGLELRLLESYLDLFDDSILEEFNQRCKLVDHKDHDGLNCTLSNLRVGDKSLNLGNLRPYLFNNEGNQVSSKYRGVYLNKQTSKWVAAIHSNEGQKKTVTYLGCSKSEKHAAILFDREAIIRFGSDFAYTNQKVFPEDFLDLQQVI